MAELDPASLVDLYWAGRCVLVRRRDDIAVYDRVFRRFFLGADDPVAEVLRLNPNPDSQVSQSALIVPATDQGTDEHAEEAQLGLMASDAEAIRHKAFAACTPEELAAVRRIMARIRLTPPRRRTRRTTRARRDRPSTCAGWSGRACACTASLPNCTGGTASCGCVR